MRWERHGHFGPIRTSLRAKVTLGILLPLLLILGGITAVQVARHETAVLNSAALVAANAGRIIEETLRREITAVHFDNPQNLPDSIVDSGDFRVIYLLDRNGVVLAAPGGIGVGTQLSNDEPDCVPCHRLEETDRPESIVIETNGGERVFRSMIPMANTPDCAECHEEDAPLAFLMTDTPMTALEATLTTDFWENLLWLASAVVISVIVVNVALNQLVLNRLSHLTQALTGFGHGRHDLRLPENDPDEIGQLANAFNEMGRHVEMEEAENLTLSEDLRRQSALRGQLLERLITAQEDERKRFAREIHDELGQAMGGLALQAEVLQRFIAPDDEQARAQLAQMKSLITTTTDSMYDMILALRPSVLDDLGLTAALRAHAERALANTGIKFEMDVTEFDGRLPPEMETSLYRMFQEALTNVIRHASAKTVRFCLARQDGWFIGRIEDNGRGFNPHDIHQDRAESRGLGLLGMKERVAQFGGELGIESEYGNGTFITIRIPMETLAHE
ncbi:MAG: HAMP domain-containing sensor histidine kinase [Chloroflexi bacterium]|nr:HAMP domain-containing sensor histidine kinase [Chloroflexota bacterium]